MYTVAVLTMSDALVELPNLLAAAVMIACMAEFARMRKLSRALRGVLILVAFSAPIFPFAIGSAKNDMLFTMWILSIVFGMACAVESPEGKKTRWGIFIGLAMALAVGTKAPGMLYAFVSAVIIGAAVLRKFVKLREGVATAVSFVVAGLPCFLFVWVRAWLLGGNSLGITQRERSFSLNVISLVTRGAWVYIKRFYIHLSANITSNDTIHYGWLFAFILLPVFVVFVVLDSARYFRAKKVERGRVSATGVLAVFALLSAFVAVFISRASHGDPRWTIWIIPVMGAYVVLTRRERLENEKRLLLGVMAALAISATWMVSVPSAAKCLYKTVRQGRFLRTYDTLPWAGGLDLVDKKSGPDDVVLYLGGVNSWQYPCWGPRFTRRVLGVADEKDAEKKIMLFPRFVVIDDQATDKLKGAVKKKLDEDYLLIFKDMGRTIYELKAPGPTSRPAYAFRGSRIFGKGR